MSTSRAFDPHTPASSRKYFRGQTPARSRVFATSCTCNWLVNTSSSRDSMTNSCPKKISRRRFQLIQSREIIKARPRREEKKLSFIAAAVKYRWTQEAQATKYFYRLAWNSGSFADMKTSTATLVFRLKHTQTKTQGEREGERVEKWSRYRWYYKKRVH